MRRNALNILMLVLAIFVAWGIVSQTIHTYQTKSVADIVSKDIVFRLIASCVWWIKHITMKDKWTIVADCITLFPIIAYSIVFMAIKFG